MVGEMQKPKDNHPSYLICSSCGAMQLTYEPMEYQEELHSVNTGGGIDIIFCAGGYGSGKSRATLQEFLMRALENPRGSGIFAAQTLGQLKKTTLKLWFEEICPPPLIENYNKSDGEIKLINGFTIFTVATDEEQKIRSMTIGIAHLEEVSGIKQSIYVQLQSRMRDPYVKNKAIICCTNPANTWIKGVFVDNDARKDPSHPQHDKYNPFIRSFIWATKLNKKLPENFIEMNTVGKPEWYVKKYFEGSFEYNSGMVYPDIAKTFITPYPVIENKTDKYGIPLSWERVISLDHGLRNPTAVLFGAIDPKTGELVIYNEYYVRERTLPEHAKHIKPLVQEIQAGLLRFMVADPAIKQRSADVINGKSVQTHYGEHGLFFQTGNNDLDYGLAKVNSYIFRGRIKIYKTCVNLIEELLGYVYPELDMDNASENQDEKPIKANDHACDSLRYMIAKLPEEPDDLKGMSFEVPDRFVNDYRTIPSYKENDFDEVEFTRSEKYNEQLDYLAYY